jgi:hypothetical protein
MKTDNDANQYASVWEHIVDDLLDISCQAAKDSRDYLCEIIRARKICAESITTHPSFTIGRMVIVIREDGDVDECWFYDPKLKRIKKLVRSIGEFSREH